MKITAISFINGAKLWSTGERPLAHFNVEFAGIELRECLLLRGKTALIVLPPHSDSGSKKRAARIIDPALRAAMAEAAHRAFVAIGGVENAA